MKKTCCLLIVIILALCIAATGKGKSNVLNFQTVDFPGADSTYAYGINSRGEIVGEYDLNGVTHGYILSRGTFQTLDYPDPQMTATAIEGGGRITRSRGWNLYSSGRVRELSILDER